MLPLLRSESLPKALHVARNVLIARGGKISDEILSNFHQPAGLLGGRIGCLGYGSESGAMHIPNPASVSKGVVWIGRLPV